MKIFVHDYAGHPYAVQLSRAMSRRGHEVLHVYSASNTMPRGALTVQDGDPDCFTIKGLSLGEPIQKSRFIKRRQQEIEHGRKVADEITSFRPDVVISGSTPLDTQRSIWKTCRTLGIANVFWLQDMTGIATNLLLKKRLPFAGAAIGHHYIKMEEQLLRNSSAVVAIAADFLPLLREIGVRESKIHLHENWGPLEEVDVRPRVNAWSERNNYSKTFNFIYSGSLGMKHNPQLLIDLAQAFQKRKNVRVVVITEGMARPWLEQKRDELGLTNLDLLDFQPYEDVPNVMGAADVLVAILEPSAGIFSVPSKVLSCLCSGRPLLLAVPKENLAAQTVCAAEAGLVASPTSNDEFIKNAEILYGSVQMRTTMGENGRRYAEETFDIEIAASRFLEIFRKCAKTYQTTRPISHVVHTKTAERGALVD